MASQEEIQQQQELLAAYRRTLAHLLRRAAAHGGETYVPPEVANGIHEARENIAHIKGTLHGWGVQVDDQPADEAVPPPRHAPDAGASARPIWKRRDLAWWAALAGIIALLVAVGQWLWPDPLLRSGILAGGQTTLPTNLPAPTSAPTMAPQPTTVLPSPAPTDIPASPPPAPTILVPAAPSAAGKMLVEVTVVSITIHAIPQPHTLDRLEPKDEGDITINFNLAGQERRWPADPQVKHMRAGETAPISEIFQVPVSAGVTPALSVDVLEMDPEPGNENDLILHETQPIDINSDPLVPRVIRDRANGYAEIAYTVSVTPIP